MRGWVAISFSSYNDSACSSSLLCCIVTYLDIRFLFHFLFKLSTCEDHQDAERGKGNLPEKQVILRKCSSSKFKECFFFFLSQIASFLPRLVQIIKLNFWIYRNFFRQWILFCLIFLRHLALFLFMYPITFCNCLSIHSKGLEFGMMRNHGSTATTVTQ